MKPNVSLLDFPADVMSQLGVISSTLVFERPYDGFATLADALTYSYDGGNPNNDGGMFADILDKSKMDEILPGGFEYRIIYERVMSLPAE